VFVAAEKAELVNTEKSGVVEKYISYPARPAGPAVEACHEYVSVINVVAVPLRGVLRAGVCGAIVLTINEYGLEYADKFPALSHARTFQYHVLSESRVNTAVLAVVELKDTFPKSLDVATIMS
jgi:hypothetical protein